MHNGTPLCFLRYSILHTCKRPTTPSSRRGSRPYSSNLQWQPLQRLNDGGLEHFRSEAFNQALPALLPKEHFKQLPALRTWFSQDENPNACARLNIEHLSKFRDAAVPLELTRATSTTTDANSIHTSFQRAEGPLGVFIDWAETATEQTQERIYLAQASIRDLPQALKDGLPTPELVLKAGKGDVYDTSIWLGVPPTYTPLHKDPNPNLFVQLAGRKVVRLLPPEAGREVFAGVQAALGRGMSASFRGEEMMEGEEKRLLEIAIWNDPSDDKENAFAGQEAHLGAGDGLFIPQGWWHSIKGVCMGINGSANWWFR